MKDQFTSGIKPYQPTTFPFELTIFVNDASNHALPVATVIVNADTFAEAQRIAQAAITIGASERLMPVFHLNPHV